MRIIFAILPTNLRREIPLGHAALAGDELLILYSNLVWLRLYEVEKGISKNLALLVAVLAESKLGWKS